MSDQMQKGLIFSSAKPSGNSSITEFGLRFPLICISRSSVVACRPEAELQAVGSAQNKQNHEHLYSFFCVFIARVPCRPD